MIDLDVNGRTVSVEASPDTPLLWVLRDELGLKGSKFGCGAGLCGACTVHVDGVPVRSCVRAVGGLAGAAVRTIEGLGNGDGELHPVQRAWLEEAVPQCGYCQSGLIMAVVDLLERHPEPTDEQIERTVTNLCRCGTYARVRKAVHRAAALARGDER